MGQRFSVNVLFQDIKVVMSKYFPKIQIVKILNNGMLSQTLLILNEKDNTPLILKCFMKYDYDEADHKRHNAEIEKYKILQKVISSTDNYNIAPILLIDDDEFNFRIGMIYRQYFQYNLKERIYLLPYFSFIEKIWITFQLLVAVNHINSLDLVHGDLKPQNILLTSNLSLYISDFATYKPAFISMEDTSYTYYFGSNSSTDMSGCYLAPERLVSNNELKEKEKNKENIKNSKMDIFSLGAIIAELFLEQNLFDFTSLLNYKKQKKEKYNIDEYLEKIENDKIRELIYLMLKINPEERISISEALNFFIKEICPISIKGFIFHFNAMINTTNFWKPDLIIGHLYRNWNPVWKMIYGPECDPPKLYQKLNLEIANKIILDDPFYKVNSANSIFKSNELNELFVDKYKLNFYPQKRTLLPEIEKNEKNFDKNNKDCIFIIINYLLQSMQNCKYNSSILVSMEMIFNLVKSIDDVSKLNLIIPYYINNLKKRNYLIKISSLKYIFDILYTIDYQNLILPVLEYNYFHTYVLPYLLDLCKNPILIPEFFNNLEKIIDLETIFLNITLKSRILRLKEKIKKEEKELKQKENKKNNKKNNNKAPNENLMLEIYKDYDNSIEEFTNSIHKIITDVIGGINEIDLLILVIRKLPVVLEFFGKSKSNDFNIFILNNFNKREWLLQKEILIQLPRMLKILGRNNLIKYIMPCLESLIMNNSNEIKIIELLKAVIKFLDMGYLYPNEAAYLFYNENNNLNHFFIHPSINIRNYMIKLLSKILSKISKEEAFIYLYEPIKKYIDVPLLELDDNNINNFKNNLISNLSRVVYQLELNNVNYESFQNYEFEVILPLIGKSIDKFKEGNKMAYEDILNKNYEEIRNIEKNNYIKIFYNNNYFYNSDFNKEILLNKLDLYKKHNLKEPLDKYIQKEVAKGEQLIGNTLETKIFSSIFWISDVIETYKIPKFNDNNDFPFENNNTSIISLDPFKISYLLKTLGIYMKLIRLGELLKDTNKKNEIEIYIKKMPKTNLRNNINIPGKQIKEMEEKKYLINYNYNKNFINWRPKGQIISTLYDHNNTPVEKILPMKEHQFCSFDNKGNAIVWKINNKDNDNLIIDKVWDFNCQNEYPIKYKNVFAELDNLTFVLASKNYLIQYYPSRNPDLKDATHVLCETIDKNDITCLKSFGYDTCENQKIIFGDNGNKINISDQRMNQIALYKQISKHKGTFSCISDSFYENNFYIGTLDGNLLYYDLRINDVIEEYKYGENDNIPILDINLYRTMKNVEYDIEAFNSYNKYLVLLTANDEHEITFWNYRNNLFNCDLLLTVNMIDNNDEQFKALPIDIPSLNKKYNKYNMNHIENMEYKYNLDYLYKLSHIYSSSNTTKKTLLSIIKTDYTYYLDINPSKISNFYENFTTPQRMSLPHCGRVSHKKYFNTPYIISCGNDMTIRYWDFTKEKPNNINNINPFENKMCYIINAHNNISYSNFSKSCFNGTEILQSNEKYDASKKKKNISGLSEYEYFNGIAFHSLIQNDFDESSDELKFCTRLADAAHKNIISDILTFNMDEDLNLLISSSWDGTVKIWK
jgi:hypothetical protein